MIPPQNFLITQFSRFIESEQKREHRQAKQNNLSTENGEGFYNRQAVINFFNDSNGVCAGLTAMWAYGKYVSQNQSKNLTDGETLEDKSNTSDNYEFFNKTINLISNFDPARDLSEQERKDIERLMNNIMLFQATMSGSEIEKEKQRQRYLAIDHNYENSYFLSGLKRGSPNLASVKDLEDKYGNPAQSVFNAEGVFPQDILEQKLQETLKPGTMIFLSNINHVTSVYMNTETNKIEFYDPNIGEMNFNNMHELSEQLWNKSLFQDSKIDKTNQKVNNTIRFLELDVKQFKGDQKHHYPNPNEWSLLTQKQALDILNKDSIILTYDNTTVDHFMEKNFSNRDEVIDLLQPTNDTLNNKAKARLHTYYQNNKLMDIPQDLTLEASTEDFDTKLKKIFNENGKKLSNKDRKEIKSYFKLASLSANPTILHYQENDTPQDKFETAINNLFAEEEKSLQDTHGHSFLDNLTEIYKNSTDLVPSKNPFRTGLEPVFADGGKELYDTDIKAIQSITRGAPSAKGIEQMPIKADDPAERFLEIMHNSLARNNKEMDQNTRDQLLKIYHTAEDLPPHSPTLKAVTTLRDASSSHTSHTTNQSHRPSRTNNRSSSLDD